MPRTLQAAGRVVEPDSGVEIQEAFLTLRWDGMGWAKVAPPSPDFFVCAQGAFFFGRYPTALQAAPYPYRTYRTAAALIRFRTRKFPVESRSRSLASSVGLTSAACVALTCGVCGCMWVSVSVSVGVLLL